MPPENRTDSVIDSFIASGANTDADTPQPSEGSENEQDTTREDQSPAADEQQQQEVEQPASTPAQPDKSARGKERVDDKNARRPGDITDPRTGQIIRAGGERRQYERAVKAEHALANTRQHIQRMETELNAFRTAASLPQQYGLTPDETTQGVQLMAAWKQNPVETVKYLLEQAKALGHNVDGLTGGVTDMGAIKRMIAEATEPLRTQTEQQRAAQESEQRARADLSEFVAQYGDVGINANGHVIADLMNKASEAGQRMSLEVAWNRFENWCLRQGLDPYQSIDAQVAARRNGNGAAPQNGGNGPTQMHPRGRPASQMQPNAATHDPVRATNGNERNADIVRQSLREAGYSI